MNAAPTQELRLAVTMTGGVSLAIWMGGVARELNLLSMASRHWDTAAEPQNSDQQVMQLYRRLLDLTKVSVDIDVLSGTSAGGINAAVLGYAKANDKDIESWGAQWNSLASLEDLLRDPKKDKNPPSLLRGDSYLYPKLLTAIQGFPTVAAPGSAGRTDDNQPATTVFITTTLLNGEVSRFTDSYGTMIQDTDHQGLFTFDHASLTGGSADLIPRLALAGRCTSSFPAAFEPAFVPYLAATPKSGAVPVRPAMDRFIDITRPHWVADGGLLANRPIRPILQTIFDRPADLPVRRVLLYVVPSSGPTEDPLLGAVADDSSSPLSMTSALVKDLSAVLSQSIAADLRAIQDHNDTVDALTDSRLQLAQIGAKLGCRLTAVGSFLADYADREGRTLAQPVVREVTRLIDGAAAGHTGVVPASWKGELENGSDTEQKCLEAAIEAITEHWVVDEPPTQDQIPAYGRPAWDGAKATALAMLRLAQQLADAAQTDLLRRLRNDVHEAFVGVTPRPDVVRIVRGLLPPPGADPTPPAARATPAAFCGSAAAAFAEAMAAGMDATTGTVNATADYAALRDAWQGLTKSLSEQEALFRDLAAKGGTAADQLATYVEYLFAPDGPGLSARLFDLHAAQRAITPLTDAVEQRVELIQVSADTRTALDDKRSTAASKLTGMQLQHFGAFYKKSWRANDWMWGRVDAAGWLVHMLLQPQRLRDLFGTLPGGRAAFLEALGAVVADQPEFTLSLSADAMNELAFLESPDVAMPPSLPNTSMAVAEAVQRWIADKELPAVAGAIQVDIDNHSANWRGEKEWVTTVLSGSSPQVVDGPKDALVKTRNSAVTAARLSRTAELFRANPVPGQTFSSEVGQPLLARTMGKALATGTNALTTAGSELSALKPLFASLRGVTLTTYMATKATKSTPRALLEAGAAMIVVGFVLALGWGNVLGVGGIGLIVAGLAVLALGVWGVSWRGLLVFLGFLLIVALIAPALPVVRLWLFSTDSTDLGVVTPWLTSLPQWLGSQWWHPLAVIGVLLVVVAVISFGFGHSRQLRRRNQALRARIGKRTKATKELPRRRRTASHEAIPVTTVDPRSGTFVGTDVPRSGKHAELADSER